MSQKSTKQSAVHQQSTNGQVRKSWEGMGYTGPVDVIKVMHVTIQMHAKISTLISPE